MEKTRKKNIKKDKTEVARAFDVGLKIQWVRFINKYIANGGNGTQAYLSVYTDVADENVARAAASRLLANVNIREEINNKMNSQRVTENAIVIELWKIAKERKEKNIYAAVKALEILARIRGLLTDTKKIEFTAENPCIFPSLVMPEEAKKFKQMVKDGIRISE